MSHLLIVKRLELYMDLALYKINILLLLHYHSFANVLIIVFNANIIIVRANFQSTEGRCSMMYLSYWSLGGDTYNVMSQ